MSFMDPDDNIQIGNHRVFRRCTFGAARENPADAKIVLTGNGRAKKNDMVVAAVKRGYRVADEHQADAVAVALAAYDHIAP